MAALEGDVKIPGLGEVPKKRALIIAGIAAVIVAGVLIVRGRSASSASAPATSDSADDTGDGSDLDAAGYVIGSPQDIAYQDSLTGDASDDEDIGDLGDYPDDTEFDAAGYPVGSAADLAYQSGQTGTGAATANPNGITTNSQWLSEAEGVLPGDQSTIQAALSGVLGGLTVTTAQKNLFLEAVGILQAPPQGYPQPIKTSDTAAHPGAAAQVTVPKVTGQPQEAGFAILAAAGFKASGTKVVPGKVLTVDSQSPAAGAKAAKGSVVTLRSSVHSAPVKK